MSYSEYWWQRPDLFYDDDAQLVFAEQNLQKFANQAGTPSFLYNGKRVIEKLEGLHACLNRVGFKQRFNIFFAMKANRFAPLLSMLKHTNLCGIDACSPAEVEHAISCGFRPEQISFTATSLSEQDFQFLYRYPDVFVNCDSLHTIRRLGQLCPGRKIGIRVNPEIGVGYGQNSKLKYSGKITSKFGIYKPQFDEALALAAEFKLVISKIHFHTGCGYLNRQLEQWDDVIEECRWFISRVSTLEAVNVGGGLGVPHVASDSELDLARWATILFEHFHGTNLNIEIEPGDYLLKDAGVLLLTVNSVEKKSKTRFVGLNAGFNLAVEPAVYGLPFEPLPLIRREGKVKRMTLVGNINEALDVWYKDIDLPPLESGDHIALINAGAYSSSMSSNHCMRGEFKEFLLV